MSESNDRKALTLLTVTSDDDDGDNDDVERGLLQGQKVEVGE